ncbi:hypothetical protein K0T92_14540 [Paenibacillus oenotherae]|uniref:Uncharacterized protein n=1 Tax=Paenibacillus oenotherae TaxID=1435645 RepID=A0ABS7D7Z5_9BACL|nr:hypothetical protein [Paenibacillus oenotherae]MBW7475961.1 hypothetical protein [Paenibacillus oenotherae]
MNHKHYYRLNEDGVVILAFSDAFQQPESSDYYVEDGGRHFNPLIINGRGQYIYRLVSGEMIERSTTELDEEWDDRLPSPRTPIELLQDQIDAQQAVIDALLLDALGGALDV